MNRRAISSDADVALPMFAGSGADFFLRARAYSNVAPAQRVLVAIVPCPGDWELVRRKLWYRIPVRSAPAFDYAHVAFYLGHRSFGQRAWQIGHWASVENRHIVTRRELFPDKTDEARAGNTYFKLGLGELRALPRPIVSRRGRFSVFCATTLNKLLGADELNDLRHDSPLEDELWRGLKAYKIEAERQWHINAGPRHYCLDFAVFCARGGLNIECDGDSYHANAQKGREDNIRNNDLTREGWAVLRFNTHQIVHEMGECLETIRATIAQRGDIRALDF